MNKKLIIVMFSIQFLPVFKFFKTNEINYFAYLVIFFSVYIFIKILKKPFLKIDYSIMFWLWFVFLFFFTKSISTLMSNYSMFLLPIFALSLYVFFKNYTTKDEKIFFLNMLVFTAFFQAILGIMQSIFQYPFFENISANYYMSNRNYFSYLLPSINAMVIHGMGTFEHFNGLGSYLCLALPIAFMRWKINPSKLNAFISLIIFWGIITTYSRGALLGIIVGFIYLKISLSRNKIGYLALIFYIGIVTTLTLGNILIEYYNATQNFASREKTWLFVANIAFQNPIKLIIGYGPFYFKEKFLGMSKTLTNMHSSLLQIFFELGLVGIFLFLKEFKYVLISQMTSKKNYLTLGITASLISFVVQQIFDNSLFGNLGAIWFSLIAIVKAIKIKNDCNENPFNNPSI